jgi:hypothetical protein
MEVNVITLRKIKEYINSFNDEPSPIEMAEMELFEAKKRMLETLTTLDYAKATVSYHASRIERLEAYLLMNRKVFDINADK